MKNASEIVQSFLEFNRDPALMGELVERINRAARLTPELNPDVVRRRVLAEQGLRFAVRHFGEVEEGDETGKKLLKTLILQGIENLTRDGSRVEAVLKRFGEVSDEERRLEIIRFYENQRANYCNQ